MCSLEGALELIGVSTPMTNADAVARRLKLVLEGHSRNAFAKRIGVPESTLRSYFEGVAMNLDTAARVAAEAGISLNWLATGKGEMRPSGNQAALASGGLADGSAFAGEDGRFFAVPRLVVHRGLPATRDAEMVAALPIGLIIDLGMTPNRAAGFVLEAGQAGAKFPQNTIVIVDTEPQRRVGQAGGWFALVLGDELLVRFVTQRADGRFDLVADDPAARAETVDRLDALTIAGRIVWSGARL